MATIEDPGECQIQQSVFEGLFVKVLKPSPAFADDLRRAGFDIAHQHASYPSSVLKASLEVACRHEYPGKRTDEGMRLLGSRFLQGFFDTIVGKLVAVAMPLLSADGFLKRFPSYFSMVAPGVKVKATRAGDHHWLLEVRDRAPVPDFNAGILLRILEQLKVKPEIVVQERSATHFVLSVKW